MFKSRDLFKFGKISDNISETVQDRDVVAMKDYNRQSYVAYLMAPLLMPFNDRESHLCCLKPL